MKSHAWVPILLASCLLPLVGSLLPVGPVYSYSVQLAKSCKCIRPICIRPEPATRSGVLSSVSRVGGADEGKMSGSVSSFRSRLASIRNAAGRRLASVRGSRCASYLSMCMLAQFSPAGAVGRVSFWGARRRSALARSCHAPTGSDQSYEDGSNRGVS